MRYVMLVALLAAGCGKEIGDECIVSSDCDPEFGMRTCDTSLPGGYCTIQGCDFNTCPDESACIRFFTGGFSNRCCGPDCAPDQKVTCSLDELCSLAGYCVPRNSESRFCMRRCDSSDDCRDGYECRDIELMKSHGGEPLLAPGQMIDENAPKFCAPAPA